jgi:hypothetical protein
MNNLKQVIEILILISNIFIYEGKYWIDPNHGSTSDAIEVNCIIESGRKKTCIQPNNNNSQIQVKIFYFLKISISLFRLIMDQYLKYVFYEFFIIKSNKI